MDYRYLLIREEWEEKDIIQVWYGIAAAIIYDECPVVLKSYTDITSDEDNMRKFIQICNDMKLDPVHLDDVVEDFINNDCKMD